MKFTQPIFLVTLSIASALTLFADAAPSSSSLNKLSPPTPAQEGARLAAASISTRENRQQQQQQQQRRQLQQRGGLSGHPAFKALAAPARPLTTTTSSSSNNNKNRSSVKRHNDRDAVSAAKIDHRRRTISPKAKTTTHPQQRQQELRRRKNHKNSDDQNRASAAAATTEHNNNDKRKLMMKKRRALLLPSATPPAPPALRKRAAAAAPAKPLPSSSTPKKNAPFLLLPDSRSVWQTGSYQMVRWNRKYTKSLPADTTVDIVLIDSKTNQKVASLKRFVPFKKGGSQVWVPTTILEGTSFVLVLELYRGRSKEPITSTSPSVSAAPPPSAAAGAKAGSPYRYHQEDKPSNALPGSSNGGGLVSSQQPAATTTADVLARIVRRSDINIASAASKRDIPRYPPGSSFSNSNENINNDANGRSNSPGSKASTGSHHDINHDDFYTGASQERSMEFLPDELRQEYPNTIQPLTLEHTFGLHQKVYTHTPYTLEWKIPERVAELLEYTRQAQTLFNSISKSNAYSQASASALFPKSTFMAKVLVEIIKDQTTESVSVLAKDVPAETMFQYLSIQDRLAPAFYRLRVQMVVVQVRTDFSALANNNVPSTTAPMAKGSTTMEGWEFPDGGEVIDRYEAITRRFWVSQGAL